MASVVHPLETRNIEIELTPELRELLTNQDAIKDEMKYNVSAMPYKKYKNVESNITKQLLKQLFNTHPGFDRIKETLIIATFRTSLTTDSGLNGETRFHTDNILFPDEKDSNLIITWGVGTEAATIDLSELVRRINNDASEIFGVFDTLRGFKDKIFTQPLKTIEEYNLIDVTTETDQFKKIVKQKYDELITERGELNLNILSSKAPNKDENITALIMAGKEVYHRRIPTTGPPKYRYVLNIYFNRADLDNKPDSEHYELQGGRGKRLSTRKKRTKRTKRKQNKTR